MNNPPLPGLASEQSIISPYSSVIAGNWTFRFLIAAIFLSITINSAVGALSALPGTDVGDAAFTANWELADGAISHRLDVATDESFLQFVTGYEDLNVGNATTWLVDGLASGNTYYYRVRALFSEGDPEVSNVVTVETPLVPGDQKWKFDVNSLPLGPLALTDEGDLIFASDDGNLYSIASESGLQNWRKSLGASSKMRPSISPEGTIFVSGYAINAETGDVIWNNGLRGTTISVGPENLIILNTGESMVAVDKESGNPVWSFNQASELLGPVISEQQAVYFGGTHVGAGNVTTYKIYAVDYLTGNKLWDYDLEFKYSSAPIIGENGDIYCSIFGSLVVLNASGGFSWEIDNGFYTHPIITEAGDLVGGSISSFNIETRTENWSRVSGGDLPESVFEPVIGDDGTIYVPMLAGGLWAFDSLDGSTKWTFTQFGNDWPINGAVVGHDGTVFFGTSNGELYAVNSDSSGLQDAHWPTQGRDNGNTGYGPNDFFSYSPNEIDVDNKFQWVDIEIISNQNWEMSEEIPWVFLSQTSGDGDGVVSLVVEENLTGSERSGVITVGEFEIPVSQSALPRPIALDATTVSENSFLAVWESQEGATNYYLDISTNPDFSSFLDGYENRDVSNSTSWFVEGLERSSRYYYRIRVESGAEVSLSSNVISVHTLPEVWNVTVSVKSNIGGSVEGGGSFEDQTEITIVATADEGFKFVEWVEDETTFSYRPSESFLVTKDIELQAQFKPAWHLNLEVEPVEGGSVTGDGSYIINESVTIVAVPNESYRFVGWKMGEEVYSTERVDSVVSDREITLTACFEKFDWGLVTSADYGTILRSPDLDRYDNNSVVQLTAVPEPGFRFDSWSGDAVGDIGSRDIIMNSDKTISAQFVLDVSDSYNQWLSQNAPGNSNVDAINSYGDLDYDSLPNYLEFVLGLSFRDFDRREIPELSFLEDGQAQFTFFARGPLQEGRLFIGSSPDLQDWQWTELFFGSGIWVSSNPGQVRIVEAQLVSSRWRIVVELVGKDLASETYFVKMRTSDTAP